MAQVGARVGMRVGVQVGAHPGGVRVGAQVGTRVGAHPGGVRVGAPVGRRAPDYMQVGVPVGVGVLVGDAAPGWTGPLTVERIFLVEAAPRFRAAARPYPRKLSRTFAELF